ncbi:MAG: HPF/RaiA family ribosome-associated protein [Rhodothermales bacterium]|nr:HPF/RaiA family ribosome-associated protein [Rhodothermales bacterium]
MNISIKTVGFTLTEALEAFTREKMNDTLRAFGRMDSEAIGTIVTLARTENPESPFRASAAITVPGDRFFIEEDAPDIHTAVTQLKKATMTCVKRWRERLIERHQ